METQIKDSLISLLDSIKRSDSPGVSRHMGRLEELLADGRERIHPQLAHFLGQRSYAKALKFLEASR
jgi:hypothetical protein